MRKIVFIFPGQGSQHLGMGKGLCDEYEIARQTFDEANDTLGYDLKKICFDGSPMELNKVENMLPAILTVSTAVFRVYMKEIGINPAFLAGHSLGEYSALVCSGALNFSDALKIVRKRSQLAIEVANSTNGSMSIIDGVESDIVLENCRKVSSEGSIVAVSCFNSTEQVVISGHNDAIEKVENLLFERNAQVTPLIMSPPFHCELMEEAVTDLKKEIKKYTLNSMKWPVLSNVTALPYEGKEAIVDNLANQIVCPVRWHQCIQFMWLNGVTFAVELGPQSILSNLLKNTIRGMKSFAYAQQDDREELLKHVRVKGQIYVPNLIDQCMRIAVGTENRNWDKAEYQKGVVEPYGLLQRIQKQLEQEGAAPSVEQMKEAVSLLKVILKTKRVPEPEYRSYIEDISKGFSIQDKAFSLSDFIEHHGVDFDKTRVG